MARFGQLITPLDPYGLETNEDRSRAVTTRHFRDLGSHEARAPGLSVIVLHLDRPDLLHSLWRGIQKTVSLFEQSRLDIEFVVGDTGSRDPDAVALLDSPPPKTDVLRNLSYNFSRCNNQLYTVTKYETILFLNNDVLIENNPEALLYCYQILTSRKIGVLSTVLLFADGRVQHAGMSFFDSPELSGFCYHKEAGDRWEHQVGHTWAASAVTGAFLMTSASLFRAVGGFDEAYVAECQDVDLCLKVRRLGFSNLMVDTGPLVHLENATRPKGEENWSDRALYMRRWSTLVECL